MFRTDGIEITGDIELIIDTNTDHPHASLLGGGWGEGKVNEKEVTVRQLLLRPRQHSPST